MATERKVKDRRSLDRRSKERREKKAAFSGPDKRISPRRSDKRRLINTDRRFKGGRTLRLGVMYEQGSVVPKDYREACRCYKEAAELGNAESQNRLGTMYFEGKGVKQDYIQAQKWFYLAGKSGLQEAVHNVRVLEKKMTPDQIVQAKQLARDWLLKH